jgi:hypothetical protein
MTFADELAKIVDQAVDGPLTAAGFSRGRRWQWLRRQGDAVSIVVEVRRRRRGGDLVFTIDWGVFVPGYPQRAHGASSGAPPTVAASVLIGAAARLSSRLDGTDGWWLLSDDRCGHDYPDDNLSFEEIQAEIADLVAGPLLAATAGIQTIDDVVRLCQRPDLGLALTGTLGVDPVTALHTLDRPPAGSSTSPPPAAITVERPDDPEWGDGLAVEFSDEAVDGDPDLVAEAVAVVRAFPGVTSASVEDEGLLIVHGQVEPAVLEEALRTWWAGRTPT